MLENNEEYRNKLKNITFSGIITNINKYLLKHLLKSET